MPSEPIYVHLMPSDDPLMSKRNRDGSAIPCPNEDAHTLQPVGYDTWHSWAAKMMRTHRQERCWGCGLFMIWRKK